MFVIGGYDGNSRLNTVECIDLSEEDLSWHNVAPMHQRRGLAGVCTYQGNDKGTEVLCSVSKVRLCWNVIFVKVVSVSGLLFLSFSILSCPSLLTSLPSSVPPLSHSKYPPSIPLFSLSLTPCHPLPLPLDSPSLSSFSPSPRSFLHPSLPHSLSLTYSITSTLPPSSPPSLSFSTPSLPPFLSPSLLPFPSLSPF